MPLCLVSTRSLSPHFCGPWGRTPIHQNESWAPPPGLRHCYLIIENFPGKEYLLFTIQDLNDVLQIHYRDSIIIFR